MTDTNPPDVTDKIHDWTFMVYMAAGDSHKLDTIAVRDLEEMEIGTKRKPNVAVVAQINRHWPKAVQRYAITSEGTRLIDRPDPETDMGEEKTITTFLQEVLADTSYKAANYCVVLWGHAFGVGFGRDDQNPLLLPELRRALEAFKTKRGKPLDLLGGNACSLSYLEAAFELKDVASLMVASQITVPFAGWPYSAILSRIQPDTTARRLAKMIVDAYVTQFDDLPGGDRLAMTMLNLTHAGDCGEHLRTLGSRIFEQINSGFDTTTMAALRDVFMGAAAGDVRPLVDLTTLCKILRGDGPDVMAPPIVAAAKTLFGALQPPEPPFGTVELTPQVNDDKLVAYHRAHPELIDLKGIGVYAPFITDQGILDRLELAAPKPAGTKGSLEGGFENYEALELFKPTKGLPGHWPTLVYDDLKRTIPAELMVSIDGIGELQTGDRADVAQIIMSMEAVLNGLDRAIARARRDVIKAIVDGPAAPGLDFVIHASDPVATLPAVTPKTAFGPPWLRLIPALSLQELKDADELKLQQAKAGSSPYPGSSPGGQRLDVVDLAVKRFGLIELAIGVTERVVRRGLTNVRFGLGPFSPNKLTGDITTGLGNGDVKTGSGNGDVKTGSGNGDVKTGSGNGDVKTGSGYIGGGASSGGDLRVDLALTRVADLFRQVGESLISLEGAAADVEITARATLVFSPVSTPNAQDLQRATVQELDQRIGVLAEASSETRRTLRRVLAHPVYGLGPGEEPLSMDTRDALALRGGLSRRFLKLL